jgi:hypothetical protein
MWILRSFARGRSHRYTRSLPPRARLISLAECELTARNKSDGNTSHGDDCVLSAIAGGKEKSFSIVLTKSSDLLRHFVVYNTQVHGALPALLTKTIHEPPDF